MSQLDPYKVLGLASDATLSEVKAAYRRLARLLHPDLNGSEPADEMMRVLNLAYDAITRAPRPAAEDYGAEPEPESRAWDPGRVHSRDYDGDPCDWVWPFGKYRGKTLGQIAELDLRYLSWAQRSFDPDEQGTVVDLIEGTVVHHMRGAHQEQARAAHESRHGR